MKLRSDPSTVESLSPIPIQAVAAEFGSWSGIRGFFQEATDSFLRVDAMGLAKQVAFSVVFALLPTIFVVVSVAAIVETTLDVPVTEELRQFVIDEIPEEAQPVLLAAIDQAIAETSAITASVAGLIALGLAIWGGMGGVSTLIEATNRSYGLRNVRPFVLKKVQALGLTLLLTVGLVLAITVSFFGGQLVDELDQRVEHATWIVDIVQLAVLLLPVVSLFFVVYLLYHYAPVTEQDWRFDVPGALFATVGSLILLQLSGFIAGRIEFTNIYGAASGLMLLLYVLNFAGIILIVGAIINGVLGSRFDHKRHADLRANPRKMRYVDTNQEIEPEPFGLPFGIGQSKAPENQA